MILGYGGVARGASIDAGDVELLQSRLLIRRSVELGFHESLSLTIVFTSPEEFHRLVSRFTIIAVI